MEAQACGQRQARAQSASGGFGKLPGYSFLLITRAAQDAIATFRREHMRVDLRLERALISGCTELCIRRRELHDGWYRRASALCESVASGSEQERTRPAPVLIRTLTKREVTAFASAWQLDATPREANGLLNVGVLVSSAVHQTLETPALHVELIDIVGHIVAFEVRSGFSAAQPPPR
jgi:hypothetical protein